MIPPLRPFLFGLSFALLGCLVSVDQILLRLSKGQRDIGPYRIVFFICAAVSLALLVVCLTALIVQLHML